VVQSAELLTTAQNFVSAVAQSAELLTTA
jgi:hypothetical protein